MIVNITLIRIGTPRKNYASEQILRDSVYQFKQDINDLLVNDVVGDKSNSIWIDMIIPGRGYNVKIDINSVPKKWIKDKIVEHFPNSIYTGKYSVIMDNIKNKTL
jgi:hypothetical protein